MVALVVGAVFVFSDKNTNAELGREFKQMYRDYQAKRAEEVDEAETDTDRDSGSKTWWFPIPEGFISTKASGHSYVSEINPYDTPEQWEALEDVVAMREVSQIPADIVDTIPTSELVLYCMNYNLMVDLFAFDTMQQGYDSMKEVYNGLQELSERTDAAATLLDLYKAYELGTQKNSDDIGSIRIIYLEAMLMQEDIYSQLTAKQGIELALECLEKCDAIVDTYYDYYGITKTMYLGIKCLYDFDPGFAAVVDKYEGAKDYIETGYLDLDSISDAALGEMVAYINTMYIEG